MIEGGFMRFYKKFFIFTIFTLIISACHSIKPEVYTYFQFNVIPLTISVNTRGEIDLSVGGETNLIPTFLGNFGVGVVINPADKFNVDNTLTVRLNGQDYFYDLHGQDFDVSFESGYYKKINLRKKWVGYFLGIGAY